MNPLLATLSWCAAGSLVPLLLPACGSSDVPIGEQNGAQGSDGGMLSSGAGSPAMPSSGSAAESAGAGASPSGGSASGGQTQSLGGAATGDAGESALGGAGAPIAGSCEATFADALMKDCTTADDCVLVQHFDCCGNIVTAINSGATATFEAAEEEYLACVPGCELRGCFHADAAEDNKMLASAGDVFAAECNNQRCTSTVSSPSSECLLDSDCTTGQVCVSFNTTIGPTSSTTYECHDNPCGASTASCDCASSICTSAGFPICGANGTQIWCDDGRQ